MPYSGLPSAKCMHAQFCLQSVSTFSCTSTQVLSRYNSDDFEESVPTKTSHFLLEYFNSFDAEMLSPPFANKDFMQNIKDPQCREISPHFSQQVEFLRQKILEKCVPKRGYIQGSCVTGTHIILVIMNNSNCERGGSI